jgi:ABC-type transport system involved in cytochrome c biogenesis permease component
MNASNIIYLVKCIPKLLFFSENRVLQKPVATVFFGLASKSVALGFLVCASKSAATVW